MMCSLALTSPTGYMMAATLCGATLWQFDAILGRCRACPNGSCISGHKHPHLLASAEEAAGIRPTANHSANSCPIGTPRLSVVGGDENR
jgi:hypothetical protein